MNRFTKDYVRYVSDDVIEILEQYQDKNVLALSKIQKSVREWYFKNQRELKYEQEENHEFGISTYYEMQAALVTQLRRYSSYNIADWKEKARAWEKRNGIDQMKDELIEKDLRRKID